MPDENKILNFDLLKNAGDESENFDKDSLLKLLQAIPSDIVAEYNLFIVDYLDKMILFNNIFSTIDNPNLCQHFIDKLNPEQLNKVGNITTCLSANDVLKQMPKILSFLGIRMPSIKEEGKVFIEAYLKTNPQLIEARKTDEHMKPVENEDNRRETHPIAKKPALPDTPPSRKIPVTQWQDMPKKKDSFCGSYKNTRNR
jgi:hypothetical protein